ncbi:hypothetical protein Cni_G09746 [Canna indica]|uniref:Uncharacterized protein n=1 Tax=Canna indica TaxID=4628 RepID=A0AAQ3Q9M2_9LILI|nr:hypothetical protein Cni_G09746 [Canna indica]
MEVAAGGRNGFAGKNGPYIPVPTPPFISSAWQDQEPFAFREAEGFFVGSMGMNMMFHNAILLDDSRFFGSLMSDAGKEVVARGERSEKKKKVVTMASSNGGGGTSVVKAQWTAEEDSLSSSPAKIDACDAFELEIDQLQHAYSNNSWTFEVMTTIITGEMRI